MLSENTPYEMGETKGVEIVGKIQCPFSYGSQDSFDWWDGICQTFLSARGAAGPKRNIWFPISLTFTVIGMVLIFFACGVISSSPTTYNLQVFKIWMIVSIAMTIPGLIMIIDRLIKGEY